jgi:hypothetical protein
MKYLAFELITAYTSISVQAWPVRAAMFVIILRLGEKNAQNED